VIEPIGLAYIPLIYHAIIFTPPKPRLVHTIKL